MSQIVPCCRIGSRALRTRWTAVALLGGALLLGAAGCGPKQPTWLEQQAIEHAERTAREYRKAKEVIAAGHTMAPILRQQVTRCVERVRASCARTIAYVVGFDPGYARQLARDVIEAPEPRCALWNCDKSIESSLNPVPSYAVVLLYHRSHPRHSRPSHLCIGNQQVSSRVQAYQRL